ncbi:MAG: glycosyltransferase [Bryobacteraceae bacterium]
MTTLHITNAWHPRSGGIRTFYQALFEAAEARAHDMRLVVPSDASRVEAVGTRGRIYHVEAPAAPFSPSYRILYTHRALLPGGAVHRILREEQPDLIEVCDKFTMTYLGGLLRVGLVPGISFRPTVVALSCERLDRTVQTYVGGGSGAAAFSHHFLRWLYFPLADHHIAVSQFVADELRAVADGHKVDRGVWIGPMGVDAKTFGAATRTPGSRREVLALTGAEEESTILMYSGRMAAEKNIPLLFSTMQRLSDEFGDQRFRLLMVGDGDARGALSELAEKSLPGLVHFAGHCSSPAHLARILASCDIFVHPNPTEPYGIAPLEAMAAGVPLVAPNSGGVLSYANPDNAWLAEPDAESFAKAIAAICADPAERMRKTVRGRRDAVAHDWPKAAARFLDLYQDLHTRVAAATSTGLFEPAFFSTR